MVLVLEVVLVVVLVAGCNLVKVADFPSHQTFFLQVLFQKTPMFKTFQ